MAAPAAPKSRVDEVAEMLAASRRRSTATTALSPTEAPAPVMAPGLVTFTAEQIALLKRQICKPKHREATNDELALFVGQCKRRSLDPFAGQIYAIFRWDKSEDREVMTVQTGIDGFRLIAERTRRYLGTESVQWCGADEEWKDVWLAGENPAAAKVVVRKLGPDGSGQIALTPGIAHWSEYAEVRSPMWRSMPANQLAKCAEALALRRAFPNDLSGIYTADEMAQADAQPLAIAAATSAPAEPEPADATVVEDTPTGVISTGDAQRLKEACDVAELDEQTMRMLLNAVGAESIDTLTSEQLQEFRGQLSAYIGGQL